MNLSVNINCAGCQNCMSCQVADGEKFKCGEGCVVETSKGIFLAHIQQIVPGNKVDQACDCKFLRKATAEDLEKNQQNLESAQKALDFCAQRIRTRNLPMKLVGVQYLLDGSKAVFYFTADGRVDFRELVRDLAYELRTRIEMKQIGVRDEAKIMGGYGSCGQQLCCSTFLRDFEPVSIRMAKVQNLTLDPTKISGVCGRLMCCLGYEHQDYEKGRKLLPKIGEHVTVNGKNGKVTSLDFIKEMVFVQFEEGALEKYPAEQLKGKTKPAANQEQEREAEQNGEGEAPPGKVD
ncbi:MAG: stage 0 sporulation family protein [Candidatus Schekmanbacteria bacterium]|nr:stage 0 sporulation family protein [Candidatus Schekmanbacteria bacterium]